MSENIFELRDFHGSKIDASGYPFNKKKLLFFILKNPLWITYLCAWYRYRNSGSTLKIELPWINFKAIYWLKKTIKKDMKIFEYGTGGSTLFFSNRAREVVSVEHNPEWFNKLKLLVSNKTNVQLTLVEPDQVENVADTQFRSHTFKEYRNYSFENYVKHITQYPDRYFDLVVIDGRCRDKCLEESVKKVKKDGWIIFDNSERQIYRNAINNSNLKISKDYYGFGPCLQSFWFTTILKVT